MKTNQMTKKMVNINKYISVSFKISLIVIIMLLNFHFLYFEIIAQNKVIENKTKNILTLWFNEVYQSSNYKYFKHEQISENKVKYVKMENFIIRYNKTQDTIIESKKEYFYDNYGNLIKYIDSSYKIIIIEYKNIYFNNRLIKVYYTSNDSIKYLAFEIAYKNDIIEEIIEDDGYPKSEFEYDNNGNLVLIKRNYPDNDIKYINIKSGNIIKRYINHTCFFGLFEKPKLIVLENYFNDNGQLKKQFVYDHFPPYILDYIYYSDSTLINFFPANQLSHTIFEATDEPTVVTKISYKNNLPFLVVDRYYDNSIKSGIKFYYEFYEP